MKRYAKNINITDIDVIRKCIYDCLDGKWRRWETIKLLAAQGVLTKREVKQDVKYGEICRLDGSITVLANRISRDIAARDVELSRIVQKERRDENSGKVRMIGSETVLHQIYDYIAVYGITELCHAKIGPYQCACVPGRGQVYGKRAIEKWLSTDPDGTRYCVKCDIKKCYPSIDKDVLLRLLHRDIKNDTLLWLLELLLSKHDKGLSIGSCLSQYLCNYMLSYAYHYAEEQLAEEKTRRGKTVRIRLVKHTLFYMDDIVLFGSNKRHLRKGFELFREYLRNELHLEIKSGWRLFKVDYIDANGRRRGSVIDMMGYKIGRSYTTVRRRIFLRCRRRLENIRKRIRTNKPISRKLAASAVSLTGWLKNCNCYGFYMRYIETIRAAKRIISEYAKEGNKRCYV